MNTHGERPADCSDPFVYCNECFLVPTNQKKKVENSIGIISALYQHIRIKQYEKLNFKSKKQKYLYTDDLVKVNTMIRPGKKKLNNDLGIWVCVFQSQLYH